MSHPVDSPRLHSHPAEDMDCYRVSKLANNVRNDSPDCIKPAEKGSNYSLDPFFLFPFSVKLAIAARLRRETTLPLRWIAGRLHLGSGKSLNAKLHRRVKSHSNTRK